MCTTASGGLCCGTDPCGPEVEVPRSIHIWSCDEKGRKVVSRDDVSAAIAARALELSREELSEEPVKFAWRYLPARSELLPEGWTRAGCRIIAYGKARYSGN